MDAHLTIYILVIVSGVLSVFFAKKSLKMANRLFFLLISITLLVAPVTRGDGPEYYRMTESLLNHASPDWQDKDVQTLNELRSRFLPEYFNHKGYYKAKNNKLYSHHFWGYSLVAIPVKVALRLFHLNEWKAFQITNAILLVLALFHIVFISKSTELQKMLFSLLVVFCPAFWFIRWPHPEIFSYTFVIMALVYVREKRWPVAVLCAAIAAMQNQPLVFLALFFCIKGLVSARLRWKESLLCLVAVSPAFFPNIFYYVTFGIPSLLAAKAASLGNMSFFRVWEMFFDLNIGMMPYLPVVLFVYCGVILKELILEKRITLNVQLFLVLLFMMALCTVTTNWNHGTSGPIRYVIWMLPVLFFALVNNEKMEALQTAKKSTYVSIIWLALVIQGTIALFIPSFTYVYHTPLARFALNYFPALYNPDAEIFAERTIHHERVKSLPVIYSYKGRCKKAVAMGKQKRRLVSLCGCVPKAYLHFFNDEKNAERLTYVNW